MADSREFRAPAKVRVVMTGLGKPGNGWPAFRYASLCGRSRLGVRCYHAPDARITALELSTPGDARSHSVYFSALRLLRGVSLHEVLARGVVDRRRVKREAGAAFHGKCRRCPRNCNRRASVHPDAGPRSSTTARRLNRAGRDRVRRIASREPGDRPRVVWTAAVGVQDDRDRRFPGACSSLR